VNYIFLPCVRKFGGLNVPAAEPRSQIRLIVFPVCNPKYRRACAFFRYNPRVFTKPTSNATAQSLVALVRDRGQQTDRNRFPIPFF
jgi:hypothetical protein